MNRYGFLLGLFATGGQILLLRELLAAFHGSELFIGTALFGWLIWVALGAYIGGRVHHSPGEKTLLTLGAILLPLALIGTRLLPLTVTGVSGEHIPFTTSALLAALSMLPVGLLSGWLFPTIVGGGQEAERSIVTVYFYEGLGAFAGGVALSLTVGGWLSSLAAAGWLGVTVCAELVLPHSARRVGFPMVVGVVLLLALLSGVGMRVNRWTERVKHPGYDVAAIFDTHYGRQAIITREGHTVLLTDNVVEAQTPDIESAELAIIPPLLYRPEAKKMLIVGRTEFGIAGVVDSFPSLMVTAVDPRSELSRRLDDLNFGAGEVVRVTADPVRYIQEECLPGSFDVVALDLSTLDSYATSRMLNPEVLGAIGRVLGDDGLLYVTAPYDTERYTSPDVQPILAMIRNGLSRIFPRVVIWPGGSTRFFAGSEAALSVSTEQLTNTLSELPIHPRYLDSYRLADMLNDFRSEQLAAEIPEATTIQTLDRPLLTTLHATFQAARLHSERILMSAVTASSSWLLVLPVALAAWLAFLWRERRDRYRRIGLWFFFVAGMTSLAFELLSFYLFQCAVGSLYSQVAVLVGTFMFGLAVGAWFTARAERDGFEYLAVATLVIAGMIFLATSSLVDPRLALVYHMLFLLTTALATGSLFAAATRRYYGWGWPGNRGVGYAVELIGSGLSALLVTTVLLPAIGLNWLLVSIIVLLVLTIVVSALARNGN